LKGKNIMIAISDRALLARVNRRLAKQDDPEIVRMCREDSRDFHGLGRYYVVDWFSNFVTSADIDLEQWARELKAI
jgi:hypothetical protein